MNKKYFLLFPLLLLPPIALAYMLNWDTPGSCTIAGEPKDWIAFWGNYSGGIFSGLISFIIIYLTLEDNHKETNRILQHNHQENQTLIEANHQENTRIIAQNHTENQELIRANNKETDKILAHNQHENEKLIKANADVAEFTINANHNENTESIRANTIDTCRILTDSQIENKRQREYEDFLELKRNIATRFARLDIVKYVGAVSKPREELVLKNEIENLNKWHEEIIIDVNSFIILYTGEYEDLINEYKKVADQYLAKIQSLIVMYQGLQVTPPNFPIDAELKAISDFILELKKLALEREKLWRFTQPILQDIKQQILPQSN